MPLRLYEEEVDHIDECKTNNNLENLDAVTHEENMTRACGKAVKQIDIKDGSVIEIFRSINSAYKKLGKKSGNGCISRVCDGKRGARQAYGYRWEWCQ